MTLLKHIFSFVQATSAISFDNRSSKTESPNNQWISSSNRTQATCFIGSSYTVSEICFPFNLDRMIN